jgi:hypothetical protein
MWMNNVGYMDVTWMNIDDKCGCMYMNTYMKVWMNIVDYINENKF